MISKTKQAMQLKAINSQQLFKTLTVILLFVSTQLSAQNTTQKLDTWLKENTPKMGGRSVLMVYKDGKIVYSRSENKMNMSQRIAYRMIARKQGKSTDLEDYDPNSQLQIASCSKWLSAALVMTFVDEGKLKTTDTIGKYLPALSKSGKGKITIAQCLSHTTGIKAPALKESLQETKSLSSMEQAVAQIADLPIEGTPGTVFHYSNVGLQLAGAIIEKIGNNSFENLFQERIAKPLEMKNTSFGQTKVPLPAGGAVSTTEDYLNFLIMILNKGTFEGKRILSENSIKEMQINRITSKVKVAYSPAEAGVPGYGYGEWISTESVSSPGLFGSFPVVDNRKGYAAFMMTFYLKSDGKLQRYSELKKILDDI